MTTPPALTPTATPSSSSAPVLPPLDFGPDPFTWICPKCNNERDLRDNETKTKKVSFACGPGFCGHEEVGDETKGAAKPLLTVDSSSGRERSTYMGWFDKVGREREAGESPVASEYDVETNVSQIQDVRRTSRFLEHLDLTEGSVATTFNTGSHLSVRFDESSIRPKDDAPSSTKTNKSEWRKSLQKVGQLTFGRLRK